MLSVNNYMKEYKKQNLGVEKYLINKFPSKKKTRGHIYSGTK